MNSQILTPTEWCMQSKKGILITCRIHMLSRYCKIKSIIQQVPQLNDFELSPKEINRMLQDISNAIQLWKGVELELCTKKKTTFKQYNRTATNWYNRNKPKIFGNYFFYPLIFKYLLNHCRQIKNISDNAKMDIFINIFINIFDETIRFKKTKSQPLLPYQTVIQPNKFKDEIIKLIDYYDIKLDLTSINPLKIGKKYQKDAKRSQKISDSFRNGLVSIQQILKVTTCNFYMPAHSNLSKAAVSMHRMNNYTCTSYKNCSNITNYNLLNFNKPNSELQILHNMQTPYLSTNTNQCYVPTKKALNHYVNSNNNMNLSQNNITLDDILNNNSNLMNCNLLSPPKRNDTMEMENKSKNQPIMVRYQVLEYKPVINEYTLML